MNMIACQQISFFFFNFCLHLQKKMSKLKNLLQLLTIFCLILVGKCEEESNALADDIKTIVTPKHSYKIEMVGIGFIIGISFTILLMFIVTTICCCCKKKKRKRRLNSIKYTTIDALSPSESDYEYDEKTPMNNI